MAINLATSNIQIQGQSVSTEPFSILAGEEFLVEWTVSNLGDEIGGGYGTDSVYLSEDSILDENDVEVLTYNNFTDLAAGDSYTASLNLSILNNTAGSLYPADRYLIFRANSSESVTETDSTDNVVAVPITVSAIDLSLNSATVEFPRIESAIGPVDTEGLSVAASIVGEQTRLEIRPGDQVVISGDVINLGNQEPGTDYVDRVYLSQDTEFDESDILLSEYSRSASNESNDFFDFIDIPDTEISGDAYVLFQTDATNQLPESDETNNVFAAPVFVITEQPDLTITSVTAPIEINQGDQLSVSWTVENIGLGSVPNSRSWNDRVYLSSDTILDADDLVVGSQFNFGSIAPNQSYTQSVAFNLPSNIFGQQYLLFATDQGFGGGGEFLNASTAAPATSTLNDNGSVIESDETNNVVFQAITITAPDLTPVSVVASSPTVEFGTSFDITWTVNNIGDGNAASSVNRLFLSTDNIAGNGDDIAIFSNNQAAVVAGGSAPQTATVTINSGLLTNPLPTDVDGFVLEVENNDSIATANDLQQNFVLTGANTYQVRAKGVVEAAFAGDYYRIFASPGDTLTINQNASLSVNGVGAIGDSFLFLIDRNGNTLRADDDSGSPFRSSLIQYTLPSNAYAGEYYVRAAGFSNRTGGYGLTIQQQTNTPLIGIGNGVAPGEYYIVASTDSSNAIREGNESNNLAISADRINVVIPPNSPDLTIVGNTPSSTVQFGSTIPISWTVTNSSDNPATSGWLDYVYLSTDEVIDSSDVLISSFARGASQPALGAQESYVVNQNVTLPINVTGDRFLLFATDRLNNRPETNETNNTSAVAIQIVAPDLLVSDITTVQESLSGQPINVSWTLTNQGNGAATGNWFDRVYLSSDSLAGGDRLLGSYSFTGSINAGASVVRTQSITLPLDLDGTYRLVVVTDDSSQLPESNNSNNVSVDDQDLIVRLAPVPNLTVASINPPPTAFSSQETVVQWTVTNTGTGATNAPTWFDNVYLSLDDNFDGGDIFLGRVANPSFLNVNDSYINSLTVTLPQGIEGDYRFIVQTDSNNQVIEVGNEGDNFTTSTPTAVTLTPPPNLQVTSVNAPINAFSGQAVNLSWTVGNEGLGRTLESNWVDRIFLSTDNVLSTDDRILRDVAHTGAINVGDSYTGTTSVTLPIGIFGNYYFFVQSDIFNQVYENVFEGNNSGFDSTPTNVTLTPPPDLEVTALTAPTTARAGTSLSINYQVSNFGFTDTPNGFWNDAFYLSTDNQFDAATDISLGSVSRFGALAADQSYNGIANFNLSNSLTGDFFVFGVTDNGNVVFEIDENNNFRSSANQVQITSQPADLVVTNTVIPAVGEAGRTLQVQWTVANQGIGNSIVTSWTDRVIASIDGILGNGDDVVLGSFAHSGLLGVNESYSRTENIALPFSLEGNYQVFVATDVSNNVFESNNDNNAAEASPLAINRQTPDLQVTSVVAPVTVTSGQPINLTWTVANLGLGRTNSNFWFDQVYLSQDTFLSGDDISLGSIYRAGALEPNASYNGSATFNVPIDLAGDYHLLVRTDSTNNVVEGAFETNNVVASTPATTIALSAVPDLVVQAVDAPTQAISGQPFSLTWTVANNGASANQTWYDAVYLSQDQTFDRSSDIYLGFQARSGGLNANGTYTTTQSFNTPRGLGGRYFAFVVTDGGNTVYERTGEANNVNSDGLSTEVIIPPPSDLAVIDVTTPTSATLGQIVPISYTVQNQGIDAAVGSWNDTLYLSTDTVWDINDTVIGQVTHTGDVASGATYTGSLNTVLPGVSNGDYHVIVRSDIRNQVPEVDDANNTGVSDNTIALNVESLTLGTPDSDSLSQDESIYYRFEATAGQAVRLRLNSSADQSFNELYVRFGSVPTRGQFDLTTDQPFNSDPEIIIPIEQTGTYYVLAYGDQVTGSPAYEILAEEIPFSLTTVQTNRIGNVGESTLTIRGAQFAADTQFQLTAADGSVVQSSRVLLQNSTLAYVTFNLANESLGLYGVQAAGQGESSAVLENVVTVEAARARDIDSTITGPLELRADRNYQSTISYINRGTSDVLAPLIIIEDLSNTILGTTPGNQAARSSLQLLGVSADGATSILRPGDINQLPVYFNSNTNLVDLQVRTYTSDNTTLIDWDTFGETIRPVGVPDVQWGSFLGNIARAVPTYGLYVRLLNDLAQQLSPAVNGVGGILGGIGNAIGGLVYDVSRLFDRVYQIEPNYQPFVLPGVILPVPPIEPGDYLPDADGDDDSNNGNDPYKPFIRRSFDPNDILGPVGFGADGWIDTDEPLKYTIRFENAITATAPAQKVVITQQLDADLDFRTFRVDDYGWAGAVYELAADRATHQTRIDLTATRGIFVDVLVTITATGLATWEISSIDPATNEPPLDAQAGFLAINDALGAGEGFVSYTIRANTIRQPSETGAVIGAEAQIIFDTEEPINTPAIFNTLDISRPVSQVEALAATSVTTEFLVRWSGTDTGSALANYTIFVSDNGGAYTPWLTATDLTESTYTGVTGRTYRFYSVAIDNAGNSQEIPTEAQAIIRVIGQNEAPTAITLVNPVSELAENTSTEGRLKVADINVTDDALGTNTLSLSGTDADSFEIEGTELFVKAGTVLNFEAQASYAVTVAVDDATVGNTPDAVINYVLTVTDANEAPTAITLINPVSELAENTSTEARLKVADINVTDDALGTNALSLSGADADSFEIDGTELFVKAGTVLNFEAQASYAVTVAVDDATVGITPDAAINYVLTVTDVNEVVNDAPTAVTLVNSVSTLAENTSTEGRLKVADINVTDDALGINTLSLNGADAGSFEIDGTELFIKAGTVLNFEAQASYAVTVAVDDATVGDAPDAITNLVIAITDANEAPTAITLVNPVNTLAENTSTATRLKVADINVTDDAIGINTLSLSGADANSFEISGTELFVRAGTVLDFEAKANYAVTVTVDDAAVGNTPDAITSFSLNLTDVAEVTTGTNGSNNIIGTAGNDIINGLNGNDTIRGGAGSDSIDGGSGQDNLFGDSGNDTINGGSGSDNIFGGADEDSLTGGSGNDNLNGGTGDDILLAGDGLDDLFGGDGNDRLFGESGDDFLDGGIGNDLLDAGVGDDELFAGDGNDTLIGSTGFDLLFGQAGDDSLDGGSQDDELSGGSGNDTLIGGLGRDTLTGGSGNDLYFVDNLDDLVFEVTNGGLDTVNSAVSITLANNVENLTLTGVANINSTGNNSDNIITGNTGNNRLLGLNGSDTLIGGDGNDTLDGGGGTDNLFGGAGNDVFILSRTSADNIVDAFAAGDRLQISASSFGGGLQANVALQAAQLRVGANTTTANSAAQRFIYNTSNGDLFFDIDGSGNTSAVRIGNLIGTLSTNSFSVV